MSMFYCTSHGRLEDSDFVGYEVTNAGEEFCEEGYAEMMSDDYLYEDSRSYEDKGQEYDDFMAQYDNDPSPYDGTYSEE